MLNKSSLSMTLAILSWVVLTLGAFTLFSVLAAEDEFRTFEGTMIQIGWTVGPLVIGFALLQAAGYVVKNLNSVPTTVHNEISSRELA